jgi:hypothetical protein
MYHIFSALCVDPGIFPTLTVKVLISALGRFACYPITSQAFLWIAFQSGRSYCCHRLQAKHMPSIARGPHDQSPSLSKHYEILAQTGSFEKQVSIAGRAFLWIMLGYRGEGIKVKVPVARAVYIRLI